MQGAYQKWERDTCGPGGKWIDALNRCVYPDYTQKGTPQKPTPDDAVKGELEVRKGVQNAGIANAGADVRTPNVGN